MAKLMEELGKLPATLFSPAKIVYIAFVLLVVSKLITTCFSQFVIVSLIFLVVEIFHNDWLRIRLNNCGEKNRPDWLKERYVEVLHAQGSLDCSTVNNVSSGDILVVRMADGVVLSRVESAHAANSLKK